MVIFLLQTITLQKEDTVLCCQERTGRMLEGLGDEERRLMHLVPAPEVNLMKRRVLSRPGLKSLPVKRKTAWSEGNKIFFMINTDSGTRGTTIDGLKDSSGPNQVLM